MIAMIIPCVLKSIALSEFNILYRFTVVSSTLPLTTVAIFAPYKFVKDGEASSGEPLSDLRGEAVAVEKSDDRVWVDVFYVLFGLAVFYHQRHLVAVLQGFCDEREEVHRFIDHARPFAYNLFKVLLAAFPHLHKQADFVVREHAHGVAALGQAGANFVGDLAFHGVRLFTDRKAFVW